MEHLVSIIYIQYILFVLSSVRLSRLAMEDKLSRRIRNSLLYRKYVNGHSIDKENLTFTKIEIIDNKDIETQVNYPSPKPYVLFFREQFGCGWCLPFWISSVLLALTILFPVQLTWFNLFFASSAIVSYIYNEYV